MATDVLSLAITSPGLLDSLLGVDSGGTQIQRTTIQAIAGLGKPYAETLRLGMNGFTLANTPNMRAMRAGGVRGRILLWGDSFPAGFGTGGNGVANSKLPGPAAKLAARLTGYGVKARADWTQGWPSTTTHVTDPTILASNLPLVDPRITVTGAASLLDTFYALGGWQVALGATGEMVNFRPGGIFDTVDFLHPVSAGQGSFGVSLDGTAADLYTTVADFNASNGMRLSTISVPPSAAQVAQVFNGATTYFGMVGTRQAGVPDIEVINGAVAGILIQEMATPASSALFQNFNAQVALAALLDANANNLVVISGWFNDYSAGRTVSQLQADLSAVIGFIKACPQTDVVFCDYATPNPTLISPAVATPYRSGVAATCASLNVPYIDLSQILSSWTDDNARGLMSDDAHLSSMGHAFFANFLAAAILQPILS